MDNNRVANSTQIEHFNTSVRGWGMSVKRGLKNNARTMVADNQKRKYDKYPKLSNSIGATFQKQNGIISSVNFRFGFQGYFIYLGVGRGYVREGNSVKRGRKYTSDEKSLFVKRGYSGREINKMRYVDKNQEKIGRTSVDWFDMEIRRGLGWLAEYAGDFGGTRAMDAILDQVDKGFHTYVKYVKVKRKK